MSHFAVIVATSEPPTRDLLGQVLRPWHEFECTGADDEYVVEVDELEQFTKEYETETRTKLVAPDGSRHDPWAEQFYRDPTPEEQADIGPIAGCGTNGTVSWDSRDWGDGRGYRTKVRFVPDGYTEQELPHRVLYSFVDFMTREWHEKSVVRQSDLVLHDGRPVNDDHKYGYVLVSDDGQEVLRVVDRTNPNAKWDWWVVGGRYGGKFLARPGAVIAKSPVLEHSESGLGGPNDRQRTEVWLDSMRVGDMDLDTMRRYWRNERRSAFHRKVGKLIESSRAVDEEQVKRVWRTFALSVAQETRAWEAAGRPGNRWDWFRRPESTVKSTVETGIPGELCGHFDGMGIDETDEDVDRWVDSAPPLTTYALVTLQGDWVQKGDMGWFGMAANEKGERDWQREFEAYLSALPATTWLTVVDCHT